MHIQEYHPKKDHPWRLYQKRFDSPAPKTEVRVESRVRVFLNDLVVNWDSYDIGRRDEFSTGRIKYMPDHRIAAWLVDFIRRNFIQSYTLEEL